MPFHRALARVAFVTAVCCAPLANAQLSTNDTFNDFILEAVDELAHSSSGLGYDRHTFFSRPIKYDNGEIRANSPPLTMCVAAVAEVMITAINRYVKKTGDRTPYEYLPASSWNRMRPKDIRSHIWVDHRLDSYGTADALRTFGIGKLAKFSELRPGAVVNINRTNGTGHAVIFMNYLDKEGGTLKTWSPDVAGFRYFSAQGKGRRPNAGFGFRAAFFEKPGQKDKPGQKEKPASNSCPVLHDKTMLRDCGVIFSHGQDMLNTGYVLHPSKWSAKQRDANLMALQQGLYERSRSRGPGFMGLPMSQSRSAFERDIERKDTMEINPKFQNANVTTDD
jgi:hypothetical protein